MSKFKLGDPVRVIARNTRHFDAVGTVVDVSAQHYPFQVGGLEGSPLWFGPHELTLAEHQPEDS
ncbi:hypothetical protein [Arthrobacter sp. PsM3]|uniref:hypothetical protein n=1 Tax=Arthrobacter sp. PsM3 TaxID=3030531 RepID=UPI00263AE765|nr:hypothetical protein [Arthrobacter sp. PsM3]MDN4644945.1 hypothetical protein [Arthrobacter sp. PsM3]